MQFENKPDNAPGPLDGFNFSTDWAGTHLHFSYCSVADHTSGLLSDELLIIQKAASLRRNTFSSGRYCARELLRKLNLPDTALLHDEHRAIIWPEPIIGSVSHTNEWAVAAIGAKDQCEASSIGIDLEMVKPIDNAVLRNIATESERRALTKLAPELWHATALFSLKESIYKCLQRSYGAFIQFHDVEILNLETLEPRVQIINQSLSEHCKASELELRLAISEAHVFSLAWRRARTT